MPGPGRTRPATQPDSEAEARRAGCNRGQSVTRGHSDFKFPLATRHSGSAAAPLRLRLATRHSPLATRHSPRAGRATVTRHLPLRLRVASPLATRGRPSPLSPSRDSPLRLATRHSPLAATRHSLTLATRDHLPRATQARRRRTRPALRGRPSLTAATRHSPFATCLSTRHSESSLVTRHSLLATRHSESPLHSPLAARLTRTRTRSRYRCMLGCKE